MHSKESAEDLRRYKELLKDERMSVLEMAT